MSVTAEQRAEQSRANGRRSRGPRTEAGICNVQCQPTQLPEGIELLIHPGCRPACYGDTPVATLVPAPEDCRQRLRQLIGEGKLYELEHGLHATAGRETRMPRLSSRELLAVLLESLAQMVKPIHRSNVQKLLQTLREEPESDG